MPLSLKNLLLNGTESLFSLVFLLTLCDFKGARSIGSVQVDLFDKFNVGQKINKGHEKWIGYLATLTC